jgi:hypothetical protein
MIHHCKMCKYRTDDRANFAKHKKSKKHMDNLTKIELKQKQNEEDLQTDRELHFDGEYYICQQCDSKYYHKSSLSRHKKICRSHSAHNIEVDSLKQKIKDYEFLLEKKEWEREKAILQTELEIEKKYSKEKDKLIMSGKAGRTYNLSVKKFVVQNYPDAPPLNCLSDYDTSIENFRLIKNEDHALIDILLYYDEIGELYKYLGDFIKKNYKKDDPTQQSIWNSDTSRLTYIIKELIGNRVDWYSDKSGIKTKKSIVDPLLNYIRKILAEYVGSINSEIISDEKPSNNYVDKLTIMGKIISMQSKIDQDLGDEIMKYIAPFFYLERDPHCLNDIELLESTDGRYILMDDDMSEDSEDGEDGDD